MLRNKRGNPNGGSWLVGRWISAQTEMCSARLVNPSKLLTLGKGLRVEPDWMLNVVNGFVRRPPDTGVI